MRYRFLLYVLPLLTLMVFVFRPVPIITEAEAARTSGKVIQIWEASDKDIFFRLSGDPKRYYINRGLERGLDLSQLEADLMGHEVEFLYPSHWTPLDPGQKTIHLAALRKDGAYLFSEFAD